MALVSGWKDEPRVMLLQHSHGLSAPCGSFMLADEACYGFEVTFRSRQTDAEGVVGLRDNLKEWGCHAEQYGTVWPVGV